VVVRIAERVWPAWRELADEHDEATITLFLTARCEPRTAERGLRESVLEVQARSGADDDFFPGEWGWTRTPNGVVVQVTECDAFESVFPAVAEAMSGRGIEGTFDLYEPPKVATPPRIAHFLECRVRVRGERRQKEPGFYKWETDSADDAQVLALASRWCRERGPEAAQTLADLTAPPVPVDPEDNVVERMADEVALRMATRLCAVSPDEFRCVAAHGATGGVALVVGGTRLDDDEWEPPLAVLRDWLGEAAEFLAYASIRRGWDVDGALLDEVPTYDWPRRSHRGPGGDLHTQLAFDDIYAPDAFGAQLLGPGYGGRVPDIAGWRGTKVGADSLLLEHGNAQAWFRGPFVPVGSREPDPEIPDVLARGRAELEPILYRRGVLGTTHFPHGE
jgi:hypothetical protein